MIFNTFFLFVERHIKIILIGMFILSFGASFFIYKHFYQFGWIASTYYALIQFVGNIEKPLQDTPQTHYIYYSASLAFLTSVLGFVIVFFKSWVEKWTLYFLSKDKQHIVVCGFGLNNRYYVDSELTRDKSTNIIIIDNDISNSYLKRYQKNYPNVSVIIGDSTKEDVLANAGVLSCQHIVVSTGSDIRNLTIAKTLDTMEALKNCKVYVHNSNKNIEIHLNDKSFFENHKNIDFFSYYENAVRDLFLERESLISNVDTVKTDEQVHLLILGFGDLGQEVAAQAIKLGSFYNKKKLHITAIDKNQNTKDEFLNMYPAVYEHEICEFEFYAIDVNTFAFHQYIKDHFQATYTVFALGDDNATLSSLLKTCDMLKQKSFEDTKKEPEESEESKGPIIAVRFKHQVNMKLESLFGNVFEFANSRQISNVEMILHKALDKKAQQLNVTYAETNDSEKEWDELPNFLKDSNRAAVDHRKIKQDIIDKLEIDLHTISDDIKYKLIDVEHTRWNNFHYMHGFKYKFSDKWISKQKPKTIYTEHKFHSCLVDTSKLKELSIQHSKYKKVDYEQIDFSIYLDLQNNLDDKEDDINAT